MKRWLVGLVAAGLVVLGAGVASQSTRIRILLRTDTTNARSLAISFARCIEFGDRGLGARFVAHGRSEVMDHAPWKSRLHLYPPPRFGEAPLPDEPLPPGMRGYTASKNFWSTDGHWKTQIRMESDGKRWWVTQVEVTPYDP